MDYKINKMFILPDCGSLKAFFDLEIGGVGIVKGFRLLGGKKGLFMTPPKEQGKDSKWYDVFVFSSASEFGKVEDIALSRYKEYKSK